jgi:hypothetical protein
MTIFRQQLWTGAQAPSTWSASVLDVERKRPRLERKRLRLERKRPACNEREARKAVCRQRDVGNRDGCAPCNTHLKVGHPKVASVANSS